MFKKIIQTSIVLSLLFIGSRVSAQQTSQPLFTIVNGSSTQTNTNGNPSVTLPVLGFVLDQSSGLRPVIGITGSASVGAPLNLGFPVVQAAMPASHDYILAMTGNTPWPVLLQVRGNTIMVQQLGSFTGNASTRAGRCYQVDALDDRARNACDPNSSSSNTLPGIDSIAVSPTGSVAGLFSVAQGRIYAYGNLSQTPSLLGTFDTSAIGNIGAFGISDDGSTVIAGGSSPNSGAIYQISSGQSAQLIGSLQHPASVQFFRNSSNAIVADDSGNSIYQFTNGQLVLIASANDGIATPAGIGISKDNQRVFVGNSGSGAVTTISLSGGAAQSLSCNCTLTGMQPTSADSVFEVTGFSGGPISLFDGGSAASRMVFVPVRAQF